MLADNFVCSISFNALGSIVPSENTPVGIQHKDGVVLDTLHNFPEAFLTFS